MWMADAPWDGGFKPAPNYCPSHPDFDMGAGSYNHYQRRCERCIVDVIRNIPKDTYLVDYLKREHSIELDPNTIQVVLDVLEQKLGLH